MRFDQITLPNGLRIIGEKIPFYRSVAIGLWVGSGSQYELSGEAGISHFIEHMVFKGTKNRTSRQIAEQMDAVGGLLNAFTAKECTCFYTKVVDNRLQLATDVIADLALNPTFDAAELEKEKGVVLEEIAMSEDTPEDLVHELIMDAYYGNQPLALPILGTEEAIEGYASEDLRTYWQKLYRPQNAVLAVTGNYDWENVIALATDIFGGWSDEGYTARTCAISAHAPGFTGREKDIEQTHICLGFPGVPLDSPDNYELSVFNSVYGGAMSSRLFQRIREDSGLAYSVYSYPNGYLNSGMISVYAATAPETARKVYDLILEETQKLCKAGMTREEFDMAVEQLRASFILGQESTSGKMQAAGRRLLLIGNTRTDDQILKRIDEISFDKTNALMRELLSAPHALAMVGETVEDFREH